MRKQCDEHSQNSIPYRDRDWRLSPLLCAQDWVGGNGNWTDAGNWSGGVPGDFSLATIDNGGTAQVDSLVIGVPDQIDIASQAGTTGNLEIISGGNLLGNKVRIGHGGMATATVTDGLLIAGGGSLFVGSDQTPDGNVGTGTLTVNDGGVALSDDDLQLGSIGTGTLNVNEGAFVDGVFTVVGKFGSGTWNQTGGIFAHSGGDLEIGDGGRPDQIGTPGPREGVINLSGGVIRANNRVAIGNRIGSGTVNISGGGLAVSNDGENEIGSGRENSLIIGRGANWTPEDVTANNITDNNVTLRVTGDQSVIAVGLDLLMDPNQVFASSNLIAEITGPDHTPILAGRNADIVNGNFIVELNGYSPVPGDSWSIIQTNVDLTDAYAAIDAIAAAENVQFYDRQGNTIESTLNHNNNAVANNPTDPDFFGVNGPFKTEDFSGALLPANLAWEVEYLANEVLLKVIATSIPGDVSGDGLVNFGDLQPFSVALTDPDGFATQFPNGNIAGCDVNGDGECNFGDLGGFSDLLTGATAAGSASAIPEPASALLVVFGTFGLLSLRRRDRQN